MKKIFLITLFLSCFIFNKSIAATGEAQEYTITMTYLELCDNTSTDSSCNNPIVLGSGESAAIDIANTASGSTAASYGDITKAVAGTTYTYMQITMKRQLTVKGQVGSCYTKNNAADVDTLAVGTTTAGDLASITTSFSITGTGRGDNVNSVTESDGSDGETAGVVRAGDNYFQYRYELPTPLNFTGVNIPTIKVAFGTDTALGHEGTCGGSAAGGNGFYGDEPDVTVTFE